MDILNKRHLTLRKSIAGLAIAVSATALCGQRPAVALQDYWTVLSARPDSSFTATSDNGSFTCNMAMPAGSLGTGPISQTWYWTDVAIAGSMGSSASTTMSGGQIGQFGYWTGPDQPNVGVTVSITQTWGCDALATAWFTYDNFQQKFLQEGTATATVSNGQSPTWVIPSGGLANLPSQLLANSPNPIVGGQAVAHPEGDPAIDVGTAVHQRGGTLDIKNGTKWGAGADTVTGQETISQTYSAAYMQQNRGSWPDPADTVITGFNLTANADAGSTATASGVVMVEYSAVAAP